jgi:CRP-like cAMP-binding protein
MPIPNKLLAALPRKDYQRLSTGLERVTLTFGEILYEPVTPFQYVYFPDDSLVSLLSLADGHLALEVGMVGYEGMVGAPIALGINFSPVRALVQGTGIAMRMTAGCFRKEFRHSLSLQRLLYQYIHVLMTQVSQTAACNRFHVVEKRLARWLLMTLDRVQKNEFQMTQDFLAHMLGVRRVGVTNAASMLQQHKLIRYSRGSITILDRAGLEAFSCGCYRVVNDAYKSIYPHSPQKASKGRRPASI